MKRITLILFTVFLMIFSVSVASAANIELYDYLI